MLYPLLSAKGTAVSRGFPLEPRKGERIDHPHHVGLWFNHGDTNGLDFWNNSDAITPRTLARWGPSITVGSSKRRGGKGSGELVVEMDWIDGRGHAPDSRTDTVYVPRLESQRTVDRITTLTALAPKGVFRDNKEGVLGLRVARQPGAAPRTSRKCSRTP